MPAKIDLNSLVSRDPSPVTADMDGELVMMSIKRGNYYGLGDIGSKIWQKLECPQRVDDLCHDLMGEYEIDRNTCETDVIEFLGQLLDESLIKIGDEDSAD